MRKYRSDLLLLCVLAALGAVLGLVLLLGRRDGKKVQVRVAGAVTATFSLQENTTYEIEGADGGRNLLIIRDGSAWIEEADCPDELCRQMGKVSLAGQSIVCLPHQVVVEIVDPDNGTDGVDVFVG